MGLSEAYLEAGETRPTDTADLEEVCGGLLGQGEGLVDYRARLLIMCLCG
jgi:hypothetical protein